MSVLDIVQLVLRVLWVVVVAAIVALLWMGPQGFDRLLRRLKLL